MHLETIVLAQEIDIISLQEDTSQSVHYMCLSNTEYDKAQNLIYNVQHKNVTEQFIDGVCKIFKKEYNQIWQNLYYEV